MGKVYLRRGLLWISYRAHGKEIRLSVARALRLPPAKVTEQDAQRLLRDRVRAVEHGKHRPPREERLTLAQILDPYPEHCRLREVKSLTRIKKHANALKAEYGKMRAIDVTAAWLRAFASRELEAGKASGTVASGRLAVLRAAFRLAAKDGLISSVPGFPPITVDNARQGFVEPEEAARIFAALDQPFADAARFSYLAARRIGEVLSLMWKQVDHEAREVRWPKTKNGRALTLSLSGGLWEVIERRWAARATGAWLSPYVFAASHRAPLSYSAFRQRFAIAAELAGVPHIRPHDFRRSGIRNMIRAGVSQAVAMSVSGHRTTSVFNRYNITSTEDQRAALARTERYHEIRVRTAGRTKEDTTPNSIGKAQRRK
jgi:integrase